jgi:hypothetical protein
MAELAVATDRIAKSARAGIPPRATHAQRRRGSTLRSAYSAGHGHRLPLSGAVIANRPYSRPLILAPRQAGAVTCGTLRYRSFQHPGLVVCDPGAVV